MISERPTLPVSIPSDSSDLSLLEIIDLIANTLGIHIQKQYQSILKGSILTRVKALGLGSIDDYYRYLLIRKRMLSHEAEWQELITLLTVSESYFFRDQGQFWLLRHQILPELIEHKRQQQLRHAAYDQKLSLRLWSAGCSTGEEAYSLAILLKEMIPDYQEWELFILGTDINQPSIAVARQGIYSDWSFRATDPVTQSRYFRSHRQGWEITPEIRRMVTFQPGNLVQDPYPDFASNLYDLDLILCRNVFIYFDYSAIGRVLDKFYRALSPKGMLLTGHTELHGQKIEPFRVKSFPQSVVYQREPLTKSNPDPQLFQTIGSLNLAPPSSLGAVSLEEGLGARETTQQDLLDTAQRALTQEAYLTAIQTAKQLILLAPQHFQAHCLMAEAYANVGQYADAIKACQQALLLNSLAIEPYYLLAQIAEEQDDIESAKLYLKRIIYLAPTSVTAHLELGSIYEREDNMKQAQKIWRSLLEVLQHLPPGQIIDAIEQRTIAELTAHVLNQLGMTAK